jgi:iron complex outermembrane recepter protein
MKLRHFLSLTTCSALALTAGAGAAMAQDSADEKEIIIVTALKRETTFQEVPFSLGVQSADDIDRAGISSIEGIADNTAGLSIQNLGPGQSQVAVRGVSAGQIVRDQPGVKSQVGVYLDESPITLSLFTPDLDLFDLDRVEVLRGPQGTLFGASSVGGSIRYITRQPEFGSTESLVEANVNAIADGGVGGHVKGAFNVPLADNLVMRAVGYHTEYAGYIDAITPTSINEDVNSGSRTGGRVAIALQAGPDTLITGRVVYQDVQSDGFNREERFNFLTGDLTTLGERQQFLQRSEEFTDETLITDLTFEHGFEFGDLTAVTTYTSRDILVSRDASALTQSVSSDLGFDPSYFRTPSNLVDTTDYTSLAQEVRFTSNGDGPNQWVVGAFYNTNERSYAQRLPTSGYDAITDATLGAGTSAAVANGYGANSPFNSDLDYDFTQYAVFGEINRDVTDKLTLTAGGRFYSFEEERLISSGGLFANGDSNVKDTTDSTGFSPRFMASYALDNDTSINFVAANGFRLGGVNDPLNVPLCTPEDRNIFGGFQSYDDETMWSYEAGVKTQRGALTFNGAVFYNDINDLQTTLDAGSCSSRILFNVEEAHTVGLEAEVKYALADGLDVFFNASFIEAQFDSTVRDGAGNVIGGIEEGNRLPSVPEVELAASFEYAWPTQIVTGADAFVAGSVQYTGDRITQPSDQTATQGLPGATGLAFGSLTGAENPQDLVDLELDGYSTLNFAAGLKFDTVEVRGYINNITDENAELSFDRERGGRARLGFRVNQPRTFGVTVRKRF